MKQNPLPWECDCTPEVVFEEGEIMNKDGEQKKEVMEYVEEELSATTCGGIRRDEIYIARKAIKILMRRYDLVPRGE